MSYRDFLSLKCVNDHLKVQEMQETTQISKVSSLDVGKKELSSRGWVELKQ